MSKLIQNKAFIGGCWVESISKKNFEVLNPATDEVIGTVPNMTEVDIELAIEAARTAFVSKEWSFLTAKQRSELLKKWFKLIQDNHDELANLITAENGKPIREALAEVTYGNSFIEWYAEEARRIYGDIIPSPVANRELFVIKQPIGVVAFFTPWNFPLSLILRKAGPALAAGCTVVIKPSQETPLTALALAKLAEEVGFPKGVINVITTRQSSLVTNIVCESQDIAGISFTGSTAIGKIIYKKCADTMKRMSLELGGNSPFIVFESANIEKAVEAAMASKFRNSGQACVAANRFIVQESVYDEFVDCVTEKVAALKVGCGNDYDVQVGPLTTKTQFEKVSALVDDARSKNAKIVVGGKPLTDIGALFYEPTVIKDAPLTAKVFSEEIFGPVISIYKFKEEEEAVEMANNTRFGLAGYFCSENLQQVFRVAKRLEVGIIGINEGLINTTEVPFGGIKESGMGREGSHQGIDEFVDVKYICLGNLKYN